MDVFVCRIKVKKKQQQQTQNASDDKGLETVIEKYHKIRSLFCRWNDNKIKCYLVQ